MDLDRDVVVVVVDSVLAQTQRVSQGRVARIAQVGEVRQWRPQPKLTVKPLLNVGS